MVGSTLALMLAATTARAATVLPGDLILAVPNEGFRGVTLGAMYVPVTHPIFVDVRDAVVDRSGRALFMIARPQSPNFAVIRAPFSGSPTRPASGGLLNSVLGPSALVEHSSGELFVAVVDSAPNARIVQVHPVSGAQTLVTTGLPLFDPRGLAFEASGALLVANGAAGSILRIDVATGSQTNLVAGGILQFAADVAVSPADVVLALDSAARRVVRVDANSGAVSVVTEGGLLRAPLSIVVGPGGQAYVGDLWAAGVGQLSRPAVIRVSLESGTQDLTCVLESPGPPPQVSIVPPPADPCPADVNDDGAVDFLDLHRVLTDYGKACPPPPLS